MSFLRGIFYRDSGSYDGVKKLAVGRIVILLAIIAGIVLSIYAGIRKNNIIEEVTIEAGTEITPGLFFKRPVEGAKFDSSSDIYSTDCVGDYNMIINSNNYLYQAVLHVRDTVAPTAEAVPVRLELGETCTEKDFVANIVDATNVKVELDEPIDFKKTGKRDVILHLSDQGGNTLDLTSELNITCVKSELSVEAGEGVPDIKKFVLAGETYKYVTDMEKIDYTKLQQTEVEIEVDGCVYSSMMKVIDTVAPVLEVQDVEDFMLVEKSTDDFVVNVEDVTNTTVEFATEPDLEKEGEQEVEIVVYDEARNKTSKKAKLTLVKDDKAPVIRGAKGITCTEGDSVDFKAGVSAIDNCPVGLSFSVDASGVNTNVAGTYIVYYNAKDLAGNTSKAQATVTVLAKKKEN